MMRKNDITKYINTYFEQKNDLKKSLFDLIDLVSVATLALGLRPRQGIVRLQAKRGAHESCRMLLGVQDSVRE